MHEDRKHIVVADLDERVLKDLGRRLSEAGYRVTSTGSGSDALWRCDEHPPDLLIIDARLQDMDGLDVCGYLRQSARCAEVPVLVLTEPDDELTRTYARQMVDSVGGDYFLAKPYDPNLLLQLVNDIVGQPFHHKRSRPCQFPTRVTWPTSRAMLPARS